MAKRSPLDSSARDAAILQALSEARRLIRVRYASRYSTVSRSEMECIAALRIAEIAAGGWQPNRGALWPYCRLAIQGAIEEALSDEAGLGKLRRSPLMAEEPEQPDLDLAIDARRVAQSRRPAPQPIERRPGGWTTGQLAAASNVSTRWLRYLINRGQLYAVRQRGKRIRIPDALAAEFIERQRQ